MNKELEALEILKNRVSKLHINHKIGNKDIAKLEILDIAKAIETHVTPIFEQALNELKRLKKFKETFDNYELAKKQDFIAYENWLECEVELKKSPTAEGVCGKKLELYKRLFNVCKEYKCASIGLSDDSEFLNVMFELEEELK